MKYLTVKVSIGGTADGQNVDYGTYSRGVEMSSDYDTGVLINAIEAAIIKEEDNDRPGV